MDNYEVYQNYILFKQLHNDFSGKNFRGGETENDRPINHKLITDVHPFLFKDKKIWNRISILLEGVSKSNIPHLYSPEKIIKEDDRSLLIFPYVKGKTLEQVLEDSEKGDNPINFDLAFSIVLSIAELIDVGSSIVVSGKKSFHGFLTPDNILVDYDGNILLKNYGICPYIDNDDTVFTELEKKYGSWLTPEFLRREKIVSQSDIYHLGFILFRILTGKYFSYSDGEDFESKFSNLSFKFDIPSTDKDFLTNLINFFKRTLNPDPMKRFSFIREFKDYIMNFFHIEELSSITFNLAYFMNSLYADAPAQDENEMSQELAYVIPEEKEDIIEEPVAREPQPRVVDSMISDMEEEKPKSKLKTLIPIIAIVAIAIIGIGGFLYINQQKKAEQVRQQALLEQKKLEERQAQIEREYRERMKALEEKITTTEMEQLTKDDEINRLQEWKAEQEKIARDKLKAAEAAKKLKEEADQKKKEEAEQKKKEEADRLKKEQAEQKKRDELEKKKREEALKKPNEGDLIPVTMLTRQPEKLEGKNPRFSSALKKKYRGKDMTVRTSLLIDEKGNVSRVKILGDVPADIKATIIMGIGSWKYTPAEKNRVKVKVWIQVPMKISFN